MNLAGWTQYWSLFCPEVRDPNYHLNALVEFSDGTVKCYEFPRHEKMDLITKFRRENYVNYLVTTYLGKTTNSLDQASAAFWPGQTTTQLIRQNE
jgi:hypothetical protein